MAETRRWMTFGLLPINEDWLTASIALEKALDVELADRAAETARGPRRGQPCILLARWPGHNRDTRCIGPRRV
jgi:hypothetical protein